MKELYDSEKYVHSCHERWSERISRDPSSKEATDEWVWNQCEGCRYWVPIAGKFQGDWGVCSNKESDADGVVRFAHDGCDQFERFDAENRDSE